MEALSVDQLRTSRFKIIRNMLQDDPQLKELLRVYMSPDPANKKKGWELIWSQKDEVFPSKPIITELTVFRDHKTGNVTNAELKVSTEYQTKTMRTYTGVHRADLKNLKNALNRERI